MLAMILACLGCAASKSLLARARLSRWRAAADYPQTLDWIQQYLADVPQTLDWIRKHVSRDLWPPALLTY